MQHKAVISKGKAGRYVKVRRAGLPVARLAGVACRHADPETIGFQGFEQGFALNQDSPAITLAIGPAQGAAQRQFEVAAGVAGG